MLNVKLRLKQIEREEELETKCSQFFPGIYGKGKKKKWDEACEEGFF